jgi:RHS repeat-associated protein
VTRTNANLLGGDEVIGYDADSREISRGVAVVGGAMVTCKRYNSMGDVMRVWGPGKTANVSTCPVELAPTPYTDTTYDDHHRPSLVVRFISAPDGNNRVTKMEYNADDSVKSIQKAVGTGLEQSYVSYVYNPNGTVGLTTDAKGNTTVNLYDGHDRLYRTHYPLDGQSGMGDGNNYEQYTWDANSNLIALRKRDGQTVGQSFDALGRLVTRTFPSGVGNVQYSYDMRGLKEASQYSDGSHTVTNSYDGLGQLTQTTAAGRTLRYMRDTAGNVTDIAWPDGFHVGITYDSYQRPVQLLENGAIILAKYSYDALNRRILVELGNGTRTEMTYDGQGWLGNLNHRFTSSTEDWLASFTRNQLGEIKQASVTNNRYGWTPSLAASTSYAANALNQYTGAAGKAVTYDRNGNLTGDGVWTYGYDLDNRMKTASRSGTTATLGYDPEGRLVRTTVNGADTNLMYDGQNLAGEYSSTGQLTRRYVFGPGVDAPLVQYEGGGTTAKSWLYANQQGSIVALANSTGATTSSQAYGPFGETEGTPPSRFGYTGQQYLTPLGLYYYKARMYSPTLGRFLQTDPVGYKDDLNLYAYVKNNPVNFTDPTGLIASLSGNFASTTAAAPAAPAVAPKLVAPAISTPTTAAGSQAAIQVAAVVFGHGDRHVDDPASARLEILRNVPSSGLTPGAGFWGRTENYEYRAMPLSNGNVNIGTYYYIP